MYEYFKLKKKIQNLEIERYIPGWEFWKEIEIDICASCDLHCYNCNRACNHARSEKIMSPSQIKKFLQESSHIKWNKISILGGEPTLHPQLYLICDIFNDYKKYKNSECEVLLVTNGYNIRDTLNNLPQGITIYDTKKTEKYQPQYYYFYDAPYDYGIDTSTPCDYRCGIGFSRYGFYRCGMMAAIDRIFGYDLGTKNFNNFNIIELIVQTDTFCKFCGFYPAARHNKKIHNYNQMEIISPIWEKALERYNDNEPKLDIY